MPYTVVNEADLCYIRQCRTYHDMIWSRKMEGGRSFSAHLLPVSHTPDLWAGASVITQEMSLVTGQ